LKIREEWELAKAIKGFELRVLVLEVSGRLEDKMIFWYLQVFQFQIFTLKKFDWIV